MKLHRNCTVLRKKLKTAGHMDLLTGEITHTGQEWVVEPCGTPLFAPEAQRLGKCQSCQSGWQVEHNFPVCPHCQERREPHNVTCLRSECQEKEHKANQERNRRSKRPR
jgi:hypothetical protein